MSGCVYKLVKSDMIEINNKVNRIHIILIQNISFVRFLVYLVKQILFMLMSFPDIRTMEAEVVRCVATMFHGDTNVCGTVNY